MKKTVNLNKLKDGSGVYIFLIDILILVFIYLFPVIIFPLIGTKSSLLYAQGQYSIHGEMEISSTPNPVGSGARALGMGGAFISVADDATAASWNPAGLIILKRPEVSAVVSVFSGNKGYDTSRVSGEMEDLSDEQSRLNYLSLAYPFDLFSMNLVFSLNYQHLYEFLMENAQRGSYYLEEIKSLTDKRYQVKQRGSLGPISPALAIEVTPSLGLGICANFWSKTLPNNYWENIVTVEGIKTIGTEKIYSLAELYERYDFSGFNLHLGLLWRLNSWLRLGGVIKTPFKARVSHRRMYVSRSENPKDLTDNYYYYFSDRDAFRLRMPVAYGIGGALSLLDDYLLFSLDIYRTKWDDFLMLLPSGRVSPITMKYDHESQIKTTTQVRLGMEYLIKKKNQIIPLRAGLFYDPEPSEGRADDFYGVSVGTGIIFDDFSLDIAYQYRFGQKSAAESMLGQNISADIRQHSLYSSIIIYF